MTDSVEPPISRDGRALALVAQLSMMLNGLILTPLIIRLTSGKENAFVRRHATEALNLQIVLLAWMLSFAVWVGLFQDWFRLWFLGYIALSLYAIVIGIVGAVKGWRGISWRYPINVRIMKA